MVDFNFITVRLGKDSVSDIELLCTSNVGVLEKPFQINVKCTQVPDNYGVNDYAFLWLGSDNNKGMPTKWKQGFKAVGRVKDVKRGKSYNDTSLTTIEIVYVFTDSVNRMDILRCAPVAYYWCSSMPLIGIDDHANQTIRNMTGASFSDLSAFFTAIDMVTGQFENDITQVEPKFKQFFIIDLPNPQDYPKAQSITELGLSANKHGFDNPLQQIFYGAPGTGKSHAIKELTKGEDVIRTTFHPDSDYSTFVGCYKPTSVIEEVMTVIGTKAVPVENQDGSPKTETKIIYDYVPQAFLQAYVRAWEKYAKAEDGTPKKQYLIIEEINRGNCAQIFGDIFQLLDRNDVGFSDYYIQADTDLKNQLQKLLKGLTINNPGAINDLYGGKDVVSQVLNGNILLLPNNLYIWATMNTSDQSLFPIDSAFKRRWDWKYIPIENANKRWKILVKDKLYDWWDFLKKINDEIWNATNSEDKKLGYFFCKTRDGIIDAETFVSKVIFYLWNDVFMDYGFDNIIFNDPDDPEGKEKITFDKFYKADGLQKVDHFLSNLDVEFVISNNINDVADEDGVDDSSNQSTFNEKDYSQYEIRHYGELVIKNVPKANVAYECVKLFIQDNPGLNAQEVVKAWTTLGFMPKRLVVTEETQKQRKSVSADKSFDSKSNEITLSNNEKIFVTNQFGISTIIKFVNILNNKKEWNIQISKQNS